MSKMRWSTKAARSTSGVRWAAGSTRSPSGTLAISSKMMAPGSPLPIRRAAAPQTGIPMAQAARITVASVPTRSPAAAAAPESPTPSIAPTVPGAIGNLPSHPHVASTTAGSHQGTTAAFGRVASGSGTLSEAMGPSGRGAGSEPGPIDSTVNSAGTSRSAPGPDPARVALHCFRSAHPDQTART